MLTIGHPGYVFRDEQNQAFEALNDPSFSVESGSVAQGVRMEMRKVQGRVSRVITGVHLSRFDDMERRLLEVEAKMITRQSSGRSYRSNYAPSAYSGYSGHSGHTRFTDRSRPF